jgi:hypothetical protein
VDPKIEIALIEASPPTLVALVAAVLGLMGYKQGKSNQQKIVDVEIKVDGRLSQLIELTEKSSTALGREQERKEPGGPVIAPLLPPPD